MNRSKNRLRGEAGAVIAGAERKLCVTFGALAEIEAELGIGDMAELAARLRRLSPEDLWVVVSALLRGAGETPLVDHAEADVAQLATAVAAAFREAAA